MNNYVWTNSTYILMSNYFPEVFSITYVVDESPQEVTDHVVSHTILIVAFCKSSAALTCLLFSSFKRYVIFPFIREILRSAYSKEFRGLFLYVF